MALTFSPPNYVWVTHDEERFLPAKVVTPFKKGEAATVELLNGTKHTLSKADLDFVCDCNVEALSENNDDMVNISDLNEQTILHQLRVRFFVDKIYTYISSILISVNPFKRINLYTAEYLEKYRTGDRTLPPHAFAVACAAYNNMLNESQDQCVVCSGESGAGKSEATKVVLQFLTDAAMRNTKPSADGKTTNLAAMIMSANPILEAFGNAKTLRNNNSSRFGKLITMKFDRGGGIVGGAIINYLLEKSRVVMQIKNERNYHIFYQCIAQCVVTPSMADTLKLKVAEDFAYINTSGVISMPGVDDKAEYDDVENSMKILNFSEDQQMGIWKVVSGVLWLGNCIYVKDGDEGSKITNTDIIPHAAAMWGVDHAALTPLLTTRLVGKEKIVSPLSLIQALDCRDALTKKVYGDTFQWTVDKINLELSNNNAPFERFIGVLDIFGFESFEINSFEQLCINFCNEKLQFHFNTHIFKMEQNLYLAENITIPDSAFKDNQPTLDMIELKGTGIIPMLDEELNVPKGSDDGFLSKIIKVHDKKHPNFLKPGPKDCKENARSFGVLHYAGAVYYYIHGWMDKNKDQISVDLGNVLRASTSPFIQAVFPPEIVDPKGKSPPKLTLGTQFKNQLNNLIDTLNSTFPQFVRCMKSNNKKVGGIFEAKLMNDQLRYAGLVEVCRIRKIGYPSRRPFQEFFKRYKHIDLNCTDLDSLLKSLVNKKVLLEGEWAKGTTRVFYRQPIQTALEIAREAAFLTVAIKLQKVGRGCAAKGRMVKYKKILDVLNTAVKEKKEELLGPAIDGANELPHGGEKVPLLLEAKRLFGRIKEENRVLKLFEEAMQNKELDILKNAIQSAGAMTPPFTPPMLPTALELVKKLENEIAYRKALGDAIAARNVKQLGDAIEKAKSVGVEGGIMDQAVALKRRLENEGGMLELMKQVLATSPNDIPKLTEVLLKCSEAGVLENPEIAAFKAQVDKMVEDEKARIAADPDYLIKEQKARQAADAEANAAREAQEAAQRKMEEEARRREEEIADINTRLEKAVKTNRLGEVKGLLIKAMELGMQSESVEKAQVWCDTVGNFDAIKKDVEAAVRVLRTKADVGIEHADLEPLQNAIKKAREANLPELEKVLANAEAENRTYSKQAYALENLKAAMANPDRQKLREALDEVQNLEMSIEMLGDARKVMKDIEIAYRAQKASGLLTDSSSGAPRDVAESARKARRDNAAAVKFNHQNYPFLRTPDEYARGALMDKKIVKEQFMVWQNSIIPKSITELNVEDNRTALLVHKNLLGFMGDKQMNYPAALGQECLKIGFENKNLRDEILMQVIKQITNNPRPESVTKGWHLLCMCLGTFSPSQEFETYVMHFLLDKRDKGKGAIADFARYAIRAMEATIASAGSEGAGFIPAIDEILAFRERPPCLATIHLVDGNVITEELPITPDMTVGAIVEMCCGWLGLRDPRIDTFGLFMYDLGDMDGVEPNPATKDLIRTPRALRNEDFLGDVIVQRAKQKRKFKLVLKKKIFLPQHNGRGSDLFFERLVYLQGEDDVIIQGMVDVDTEEKAIALAGISMAVAFGEAMGYSSDDLVEANVQNFVVPKYRSKRPATEWASFVYELREQLVKADSGDLQDQFLQIAQSSPTYGMHWFYVYKIDSPSLSDKLKSAPLELLLGFNADGLNVYDRSQNMLSSYPYADIQNWNGTSAQFNMTLTEAGKQFEFSVVSGQALDMAGLILDYIKIMMTEQDPTSTQ